MMSKVILILGAGPNVGASVAHAFASKGYKVALASRSQKESDNTPSQIHIPTDVSNPDAVVAAFSKTKSLLGNPSVVVYNVGALTENPPEDPLSLNLEESDFEKDLVINTTSAFVAGQQAVLAFKALPSSSSKTFIYTGNNLNETIIPGLMDLGAGKSATAHIIRTAAAAYKDEGFKFYYADERTADGGPAWSNINGEAHGKLYVELAEGKEQGPWQQTFVKGVGYVKFPAD
ncbi:Secoisolariciresinol dehydrogenase [Lachnellula willkommii]|uniref:Secoisolariciresinol dehydrogenase n=1 Tax=Lachnellula willkommii TaxID=215461 RepID=A0A559M597_9HELO|nr:Secoisolariciresinol dehydrogenase [Lachnellula willkommii]